MSQSNLMLYVMPLVSANLSTSMLYKLKVHWLADHETFVTNRKDFHPSPSAICGKTWKCLAVSSDD